MRNVLAATALLLAGCAVTDKQAEVHALRYEINEEVVRPCLLAVAEQIRQDPGSRFYDAPAVRVAQALYLQSSDEYYKIQSDIVRLTHGKTDAEKSRIYRAQRVLCETTKSK